MPKPAQYSPHPPVGKNAYIAYTYPNFFSPVPKSMHLESAHIMRQAKTWFIFLTQTTLIF
jgi:hypothetical protein